MFKANFIRLCNQKGESPSSVCRNVGIAPATFSCWTDESVPRKATLMRIADYLGVTVDDLLADTKEETMFWENYTRLCRERGTSPTALTIELGFSNATASRWKKGAIPNGSTLKRIADYFEITVSELLGETQKEPPKQDDSNESVMSALGDLMGELTDEDVEELRKYAEFLISKNKKE